MYEHFRQFETPSREEWLARELERSRAEELQLDLDTDKLNEFMRCEHEYGGSPSPALARQYGWADYGSRKILPSYLRVIK